jgi:ribosomal protein S18 acetylase RimI-like enzyme
MKEPAGYDLRFTHLTDGPYLRDWMLQPGVQRWFPISEEKEIDDAVQCWVGFSRYNSSLTATVNDNVVGIGTLFLMPYKKVAHHCLFKLVVDPKYQRQGIGRSLLKNLIHLAKSRFKLDLMHIEVFEGNPLIHLLKELDFHEFARQEKFVKDGDLYLTRILYERNL